LSWEIRNDGLKVSASDMPICSSRNLMASKGLGLGTG
jgi:hypothetical protein